MPTLEEMTAWGPDEAKAQIQIILPKDWRFELSPEKGTYLRARFLDGEGTEVWLCTGLDPLHLLLDAFGWLWTRNQKPTNPNWVFKERPKLVPVGKASLPGVETPDFKDLDTSQINAVYSGQKKS